MRRAVAPLLAFLVLASLVSPVGGHPPADGDDYDPLEDIKLVYELRPTLETGTARVTVTAHLPSQLDSFEFGPPPDAQVETLDGFVPGGDELEYRWNGEATRPSMTYVRTVNETGEVTRTAAGSGWAILTRGDVGGEAFWRYVGPAPEFFRTVRAPADEPGWVGESIILTGPHEVIESPREGERFRLIVPEQADLRADPDRVFDSLSHASRELDIGHRHDATVGIVQPAELEEGGFAVTGAWPEFAVHEGQEPRGVSNTWVHEYVHTRQNFTTTSRLAWIVEASAEYEAGLVTLQHGNATWDGFVGLASPGGYADADLTARAGSNLADYRKGPAVLAVLDARIRKATDGDRSIETVLARMNERGGTLSVADFEAIVADVAGESLDAEIDRLVTEEIDPDPPDDPFLYTTGPDADNDRDGLTTAAEREAGTHPFEPDTDGDGRADGAEVAAGTDPTIPNTPTPTPTVRSGDATASERTAGGDGAVGFGAIAAVAMLLGVAVRLRRRHSP